MSRRRVALEPTPCMRVQLDFVVAFDRMFTSLPVDSGDPVGFVFDAINEAVRKELGGKGALGIIGQSGYRLDLDGRFTEKHLQKILAARETQKRRLHNYTRRGRYGHRAETCEHCGTRRRCASTKGMPWEYLAPGLDPKVKGNWSRKRPNCTGRKTEKG